MLRAVQSTPPFGVNQYKSGNWYGPVGSYNTTGVIVSTQNRLIASSFYISKPVTITDMGFRVTTAGVASEAKAAIYDSTGTDGRPGSRIGNRATAVATTTLNTDVAFTLDSAINLEPGWYWLATVHSWATTAPTILSVSTISPFVSTTGAPSIQGTTTAGIGFVYTDITYASGCPVTFGAATEISVSSPLLAFKVA